MTVAFFISASKHIILIFILGFIDFLSHDMLSLESIQKVAWKRAVVDNLAHTSLGIVSWLVAISYEKLFLPWNIACSLLCGLFASIIDLDHFLMAKSFRLSDAMNLPSRPPFHNSTLMLICILSFIIIMHFLSYARIAYIGWILLVAAVSHHLRDSLHRGLWLWPLNTKPIDRTSCLILTYCFPLLIGAMIHSIYKPQKQLLIYDTIPV